MDRHRYVQRAVYAMIAADVAFLLVAALFSRSIDLNVLSAICLPTLLISNFLFLRLKLKTAASPSKEERAAPGPSRFSLYACSAIFFLGTLYGALLISRGELPRLILPLLLVPLLFAVYCLRTARQTGARK